MVIQLVDVFQIFANHHENLMMVYPATHDRSEIDISKTQMLDDVACSYSAQGKQHFCHMVIEINTDDNLIKVIIDPTPSIIMYIPLHDYDSDDAISTNLDDVVGALTDAIQMTFTMPLNNFKTKYTKRKLEVT